MPTSTAPTQKPISVHKSVSKAPSQVAENERTTLVLKGMPVNVTRKAVCDMLTAAGFAGKYDFLYLPVSFKTWRFFGYCVVNFLDYTVASNAFEQINAQKCSWPKVLSEEAGPMEAQWRKRTQGLKANLEQHRNSPVMHPSVSDEYKPMLLRNGRRVAFPNPTDC
jgi:hypothetical protein